VSKTPGFECLCLSTIPSDAGLCYDAVAWILLDTGAAYRWLLSLDSSTTQAPPPRVGANLGHRTTCCICFRNLVAPFVKAELDDEHP
jgi:hypothetical protein